MQQSFIVSYCFWGVSDELNQFTLCGYQAQLIGGTNTSLKDDIRGVLSEGEIHYLRRLRRDRSRERLSRSG